MSLTLITPTRAPLSSITGSLERSFANITLVVSAMLSPGFAMTNFADIMSFTFVSCADTFSATTFETMSLSVSMPVTFLPETTIRPCMFLFLSSIDAFWIVAFESIVATFLVIISLTNMLWGIFIT